MRERYDVIVVGARVGGSALAALLGDQGVSVLLLDRARFPSTTSSTHFFRGAGMVGVPERLSRTRRCPRPRLSAADEGVQLHRRGSGAG
jgi:choline dehydrogenase-like flavoprotein